MNNIVIIPEDKIKVLTSCGRFPANGYFTFKKEDAEVEQVPETFAELKELCKDIKEVTITEEGHINVGLVYFTKGGEIYTYVEGVLTSSIFLPVSKDRTPAQMWQIIKGLIGEE